MGTESKGRFEMLWDCPGCGTAGLYAVSQRHCPNCGAPQDPTKRYFPKEGEAVAVTNPYEGADVTCPACDTPNGAKSSFCVNCGSPLEGAKTVALRETQSGKGGFAEDSAANAAKEREEARRKEQAAAAAAHAAASGHAAPGGGASQGAKKAGCALGIGAVVALVGVALVVLVAVFFFWKKEAAFVVTGHSWERTIAVETLGPVRKSDWRDKVPSGAYDVSCRREERDQKKVPDGEECHDKRQDKGDGSFEVVRECKTKYRSEPVYDEKCSYSVDAWTVTRTERAGASGLTPAPSWPAVSITRPGTTRGSEREGDRKEVYTVTLTDSATNAGHTCNLTEERWRSMADGTRWVSQVGVLSGSVDCDALKPQ